MSNKANLIDILVNLTVIVIGNYISYKLTHIQ